MIENVTTIFLLFGICNVNLDGKKTTEKMAKERFDNKGGGKNIMVID